MLSTLKRKIGGIGYCPHGGGGGGGTQISRTENYSPEEAARRTRIMDAGETLYNRTAPAVAAAPYPGSVPVSPGATTVQGWRELLGATPALQGVANSAAGAAQRGMSEDILYADANPYLQSYMQAALHPLTQSYTDPGGVMSSIRTDAGNIAGQGTSTRQGIAEGIAGGRFAQAAGDITSKIASEGYGQGLEHQARMAALAPAVQGMQLVPGQVTSAVGTQQEGYLQDMNDYDAAARAWDLEREWGPLQNWANIVFGGGSSASTAISQGTQAKQNKALGALGGAASGAALGSMVPGIGTGIGAGVGALLGLFG